MTDAAITEALRQVRIARHGEAATYALESATVGIAGLGGLGSHIAVALARMGVGRLVLVDHDRVDLSNLQRQHYALPHLGRCKGEALAEQIAAIAPATETTVHQARVDADNATAFFRDCAIVCEAFDDPLAKALLVETLLAERSDVIVVAASGMAGSGSANRIRTEKRGRRLYLSGDGESDVREAHLYAARVALCANHQAMMVLRLLLGEMTP